MNPQEVMKKVWENNFSVNKFYFEEGNNCAPCEYLMKLMVFGDVFVKQQMTIEQVKDFYQKEMDNESSSVCGVCSNDRKLEILKEILQLMEA